MTNHPGWPGPGVSWDLGLSELTPAESQGEQDELVALPWEAGGIYATSPGSMSLSVGVLVEQISPLPCCNTISVPQQLSSARASSPHPSLQLGRRACYCPWSCSVPSPMGPAPRDLIPRIPGLPERPTISSDTGRDRSRVGQDLPKIVPRSLKPCPGAFSTPGHARAWPRQISPHILPRS